MILLQTKLNGQPRDCWGPLVSTTRTFRFTAVRHRFKSRGLDHHSSTENVESSELRWSLAINSHAKLFRQTNACSPATRHITTRSRWFGHAVMDLSEWCCFAPHQRPLRHNKHYLRHHVSLSVRSTFQVIVYSCPFLCDAVEIKVEISHSVTFIRADVARPASL